MTDTDTQTGVIRFPFESAPGPGCLIEVADDIHWLRLPLPMALDHVNCYAVLDRDGAGAPAGWTLIDTGMDTVDARAAWDTLLAGPLAIAPIRQILITHMHPDHIGLAGWLMDRTGATLMSTRLGYVTARMLVLDVQDRPTPQSLDFMRRAGVAPEVIAKKATQRPFNFADVVAPMPIGFDRVTDGQILRLGGRDFTVHFGQGHAPDQITLWQVDGPIVFGADQILPGISPNVGVYATEPNADPLAEWLESCAKFDAMARDDHVVLPGHKLPFTGLPHRMSQLADNHHGALRRLLGALAEQPRVAVDCFDLLFKRSIGAAEFSLALAETIAHLNHLAALGQINGMPRADGAILWHATA